MRPSKLTLIHDPTLGREYIGRITGFRESNFSLEYLQPEEMHIDKKTNTGSVVFVLTVPGFYEIQEPRITGRDRGVVKRYAELDHHGGLHGRFVEEVLMSVRNQLRGN